MSQTPRPHFINILQTGCILVVFLTSPLRKIPPTPRSDGRFVILSKHCNSCVLVRCITDGINCDGARDVGGRWVFHPTVAVCRQLCGR
ncbi:hypothetical protein J6590_070403 [Homalodisca vitripennis]|nr:hypothetical protein J6590_070403 [Homalodisca vitripennis]